MKKRFFSVILVLCLALTAVIPATALSDDTLRFDENGEFKILHICDCQDDYPAEENMLTYINYMLEVYEPDLVVLGGDNTVGLADTKELAIEELVSPYVNHKVPFTLVFGNHDEECGAIKKDVLLTYYQKYGGEYCLAYDADPAISGTAAHNLPVLASDSNDVKFNVWLFDTGDYVRDENGDHLGYDSVRDDQIQWYKDTCTDLKNFAGETVPAIAFQHMVVGEIYDAMFPKVPFDLSPITECYNNGKNYPIICPDTSVFKGHLFEPPSPGIYNHGQYDAMLEMGDVTGIYVGHDHINTYEVEYKGINIVNTPGVTLHSYGNEMTRGSRLITVNEEAPTNVKSEVITYNELAIKNSDFASDIGTSPVKAFFWIFIGNLLLFLKNLSAVGSAIFYMFN